MVALLSALFIGGGIVAVFYGIAERVRARKESLARVLDLELTGPTESPEALAGLMERAGALAERAIRGTNFSGKLQAMLDQAGMKLRPGEFGIVVAMTGLASGGLFWLLFSSLGLGMLAGVVVPALFTTWTSSRGIRRRRRLEGQLPTVLQLLAGSLDSGSSVLHAMEIVVQEGDPPISSEFARVVAETRVGRPLLESLEAMAARVGSRDLDWTVEAIRIQNSTGGTLADTLRVLADFMRARVEVRGEVQALSAEARLSAKVLTGLPFFIAAYLFFFRRGYLEPLYTSGLGKAMLAFAAGGIVLGSLWMRRIVRRVEV